MKREASVMVGGLESPAGVMEGLLGLLGLPFPRRDKEETWSWGICWRLLGGGWSVVGNI